LHQPISKLHPAKKVEKHLFTAIPQNGRVCVNAGCALVSTVSPPAMGALSQPNPHRAILLAQARSAWLFPVCRVDIRVDRWHPWLRILFWFCFRLF